MKTKPKLNWIISFSNNAQQKELDIVILTLNNPSSSGALQRQHDKNT